MTDTVNDSEAPAEAPSAEAAPEPAAAAEPAGGDDAGDARKEMLALVDKWMPTSLKAPRKPDGESGDLLGHAGWNPARGEQSVKDRAEGKPVTTSCGDVLHALLELWGSQYVGAFGIRDKMFWNSKLAHDNKPSLGGGADHLGLYTKADGTAVPSPGDILVLRNGVGPQHTGLGHVGILVEITDTVWRTADGGGGMLPDQTASVTDRTVTFTDDNIPILKSPTDGHEKQLDGWIDLGKLPRLS